MKKNVLVLFFVMLTASYAYSQVLEFRGEGRKGIYDGKGLLTEWPEDGPELLWSAIDLPSGYSAPAISNNTIYLTGLKDSDDILVAFNLNGEIKWETFFGRAWLNNHRGSRCIPTIHENKIYVSSGMGEVVCLDAENGNIIWKVDAHGTYGGKYGRFGLAESLLIVDEKVFYQTGGSETTVIALNKNNGELIWKSASIDNSPAYVSPLLIEENDARIVVHMSRNFIFGFNPDNGEILWQFDYNKYAGQRAYNNHSTTPTYENGGIYITSGYNHKSIKLKISKDLSEVSLDWINETLDVHHGGVVKLGDYIYGATWDNNGNGKWACIDWNTGETMYEHAWMNKGSIIAAGDYLYCYDEKFGNVALVKATPEKFDMISSFKVTLGKRGPFWPHPVINKGVLYIRHEDAFMAYNIAK